MENGQTVWLDRSRLSDESEALIHSMNQDSSIDYETLNEAIGIELFTDENLWDDETTSVAQRLRWPKESETSEQSSYRYYPSADYRILNARPFSAALYGSQSTTQNISIVFANKGDFAFSEPPTSAEIGAMEQAIDHDVETIKAQLTDLLGQPTRQQFGSGRGITQLVERWDWNDHAFILAFNEGEYASLRVMSRQSADDRGRAQRLSDAALRDLTAQNVTTAPNGDVLIGNIPMVNQGPKGYCVPATFERYLRYLQIPSDMYILAMAGQTKVGGGTSLSNIIESIEGYAASQNRSMRSLKKEVEIRTIRKYIDQGLPLIWTMYSSRSYNEFANQRTIERQNTSDWDAWEDRTKNEARKLELRKDWMSAHACMIIGYNKETEEIAVSDSWGPSYAIRWVPAEQAEQVSQGFLYLIEF